MSLIDVKHQPQAQRMLQRALARDRVPHAYVFHGPDGVGKETFARGFAELLLCPEPIERAFDRRDADEIGVERLRLGCGTCVDCRLVASATHPDLHAIHRRVNREHPDPEIRKRTGLDIGVEVVRHFVIDKVGLTASRGRVKVFVIREADAMTVQAQNALLKALEEPPGATFLILLATSLDELLPTTRSRCQVIRFDSLPRDFVRAKLGELRPDAPPRQLDWCAADADGSIGRAIESVDDNLHDLREGIGKLFDRGDPPAPDALADLLSSEAKRLGERCRKRDPDVTDAESNRRGLKTLLRVLAGRYADALRVNVGGACRQMDAEASAASINRIAQAERQLDLNANAQLVIETLIAELCEFTTTVRR